MQAASQSQVRLEMISRTIAETGVRDLFKLVHALTLKHSTKAEKIRLRNKWVSVNPREWARRTDLSISVGLGAAGPQQLLTNIQMLGMAQEKLLPMGLVEPHHLWNTFKKLVTACGFKSPEEFAKEPEKQPKMDQNGQPVIGPDGQPVMQDVQPPPPKDPIVQAEEIKGQFGLQKSQMDGQAKEQEVASKSATEERKMMIEADLERERMHEEFQFKRWEAELEKQTKIEIAQIDAAAKREEVHLQAEVDDRRADRDYEIEGKRMEKEGETAKLVAKSKGVDVDDNTGKMVAQMQELMQQLTHALSADREIVRGPDGRAAGTRIKH
jgi:hypothetical protein